MKTSNKKVNEKIILLSIIGSLDAIKEEAVSIDEIEKVVKEEYNNTVKFTKIPVAKEYRQSINM